MKSTDQFKTVILNYLETRAKSDTLFAKTFAKPAKNIDDCITYILNTVQKSGCNGFADDEIFGMAVHYYDEDQIDIGKPMDNTRVVVNHAVEKPAPQSDRSLSSSKGVSKATPSPKPAAKPEKKVLIPDGTQTSLF